MDIQNSEVIERARALRDDMIAKFTQSDITQNVEWETIPFLFLVTDAMLYTAGADRARRQQNYDGFKAAFFGEFTPEQLDAFDDRRRLYGKILRGQSVRSECTGGDASLYGGNTLAKLLAALTDILVDPACADDYENAPLVLFDEADEAIVLAVAFEGLLPSLTAYAAWLHGSV